MYLALNGSLVPAGAAGPDFPRIAASAGYAATEVYAAGPEMAAALAGSGVTAAVMPFPVEFRHDEPAYERGLAALPAAARFAASIGCSRMSKAVPPSSDEPKQEWRRVLRRRLRACAPALEEHGVRMGLEFISPLHLRRERAHEFIWRMDEMLEFAHECGAPFGVLVDSWHWHHAGAAADQLAALDARDIVHVHVADAPPLAPERIRDRERLLPGEGVIDLRGFFQALRRTGYDGPVSPEVFGRGLDRMPIPEGAALARAATLEVM